MKIVKGFTLIELMIVIVIIAVITAVALPSYAEYGRRAARSAAQQEMLKLAEQLERHRGKNFSYTGFDPSYLYTSGSVTISANATIINLPIASTDTVVQYTLSLVDLSSKKSLTDSATALGQGWGIKAIKNSSTSQVNNYDLLLTSTGLRCMTKTSSDDLNAYTGCGANSENW